MKNEPTPLSFLDGPALRLALFWETLLKKFGWSTLVVSILLGIVLIYFGTAWSIQFKQSCKGYLKRAADSNTVELAKQELGKAVDYIEANNLTEG